MLYARKVVLLYKLGIPEREQQIELRLLKICMTPMANKILVHTTKEPV